MYVYIHLSIYAYLFNIFNIVTYITHHNLISFQVSTSQRGYKRGSSSILYLKYTKIKTSTTIKYKQNKQGKEASMRLLAPYLRSQRARGLTEI